MAKKGENVRGTYDWWRKKGVNMKRNMILWVNMAFFLFYGICLGQAPHQVGGFFLGKDITHYLKYADSTKKFYETLLKLVKERFGEPTEWRGDAFHVVIAWKWSFKDRENNSISLILQHNTKDEEEKKGNTVKLTVWNLIEEERTCFERKHPELQGKPRKHEHGRRGPVNWDRFVPR